jgi:hypothetical protein
LNGFFGIHGVLSPLNTIKPLEYPIWEKKPHSGRKNEKQAVEEFGVFMGFYFLHS